MKQCQNPACKKAIENQVDYCAYCGYLQKTGGNRSLKKAIILVAAIGGLCLAGLLIWQLTKASWNTSPLVTPTLAAAVESMSIPTHAILPTALSAATTAPTISPTLQSDTPSPFVINEQRTSAMDGAEMVMIPSGQFLMGLTQEQINYLCRVDPTCERDSLSHSMPEHKVDLDEYWIYKTEVTNRMYRACATSDACTAPHGSASHTHSDYFTNPQYNNYPVINVDWYQAKAYCAWAETDLPTEAEWEKAARGVQALIWPWGNDPPENKHANLSSLNPTIDDTTKVGAFPDGESPYGVLEMAGNVYEWVNDWYASNYYSQSPVKNPQGPESSYREDGGKPARVVRGGSLGWGTWAAAAGFHDLEQPDEYGTGVGFRCVVRGK